MKQKILLAVVVVVACAMDFVDDFKSLVKYWAKR